MTGPGYVEFLTPKVETKFKDLYALKSRESHNCVPQTLKELTRAIKTLVRSILKQSVQLGMVKYNWIIVNIMCIFTKGIK